MKLIKYYVGAIPHWNRGHGRCYFPEDDWVLTKYDKDPDAIIEWIKKHGKSRMSGGELSDTLYIYEFDAIEHEGKLFFPEKLDEIDGMHRYDLDVKELTERLDAIEYTMERIK